MTKGKVAIGKARYLLNIVFNTWWFKSTLFRKWFFLKLFLCLLFINLLLAPHKIYQVKYSVLMWISFLG